MVIVLWAATVLVVANAIFAAYLLIRFRENSDAPPRCAHRTIG